MAFNSGGLGSASLPGSLAQAEACTTLGYSSYLLQPACWGASYADWQAEFYDSATTLNIRPPVAPGAPANLTTLPVNPDGSYDTTGATAQALSDAAIAATQAANAAANPPVTADFCSTFSANWPYPFDNLSCSTLIFSGLAIMAFLMVLGKVK